MPTVIILDLSPSMGITLRNSLEKHTPLQYSQVGLLSFLDDLSNPTRPEQIALATYKSQFEILVPFTRDLSEIKNCLMDTRICGEMVWIDAITSAKSFIYEYWDEVSCNIIIVTSTHWTSQDFSTTFDEFNGKIIICNLYSTEEALERDGFESLSYNCEVFHPKAPFCVDNVQELFLFLFNKYYSLWIGKLICGNFNSKISLDPAPEPYTVISDFDSGIYTVDRVLEICGFVQMETLGSPGAISRHIVLPYSLPSISAVINSSFNNLQPLLEGDTNDQENDGQIPSFCVLLHGAMKVEKMGAICYVGNDWFGVLYSSSDCKKRSNLMLSLLEPGKNAVPWFGDLNKLSIVAESQNDSAFSVKAPDKKFVQTAIWINNESLTADVQKILRLSKKLPEKTFQFYRELNRVRRMAIGIGFISLVDALAQLLERECILLPGSAHPACAIQLTHAAGSLRDILSRDYRYNIQPLKTSF